MIKLLGVGAAFTTPEYWQTNYLLTSKSGKRMLIDCGGDIRHSLIEAGLTSQDIDAVYVSHLHADHIGGLEYMAFTNMKKPVALFVPREYHNELEDLLELTLRPFFGDELFRYKTVVESFAWKEFNFTLVKSRHVKRHVFSYGLLIDNGKTLTYISTDTCDVHNDIIAKANLVFHDCETGDNVTGTHVRYEELAKLDSDMKKKMVLVHYNPNPKQDAIADGFLCFGKKGEEYVLSTNGGND